MLQQSPKPSLIALGATYRKKDYDYLVELMEILEKMDANFGGVHGY